MLSLNDLLFGDNQGQVLGKLNTTLSSGLTWVTGEEGVGKTTLLRGLAGALPLSQGDIVLNGISLHAQGELYRRQTFWTDPRSEVNDQHIAGEFVEQLAQRFPDINTSLLHDLLKDLSLTPHLHKHVYMLSAGSKRKLWLAAAFACAAPVTLIDEPFAALDRPSSLIILELLEDCVQHPRRHWIVADYCLPKGLNPDQLIELNRPRA